MALDNAKNFAQATVSTGYDQNATSIVLNSGDSARLPTPPFNATWWNATDYFNASDDPNREIVRVTARWTDTLTVTRAQEGTSASTKNGAGKTYKMVAAITAKVVNTDIPATYVAGAGNLSTAGALVRVASASTVQESAVKDDGIIATINRSRIILGAAGSVSTAPLVIHIATDENFICSGPVSLANGVSFSVTNDALTQNVGLELRGSTILFNVGNVGIGGAGASINAANTPLDVNGAISTRRSNVTLANGANNDVPIGGFGFVKISGPTAAFNITGFANGVDGRTLYLYNNAAQQLTISNENAGSAAANRITTLTGADVALRAGTSFASFIYDAGASRWLLMATN